MAVIAGARKYHQIRATVKDGFMPVMKVSWVTSPLALAFAQKFLPEHTWVPFFNIIAFVIGTYINAHSKKKRIAVLRKKVRFFSSFGTCHTLCSLLTGVLVSITVIEVRDERRPAGTMLIQGETIRFWDGFGIMKM